MAFGNRTIKFDTLAVANPVASVSIAQQEVSASNVNIDPSILQTGSLNLIGAGMVDFRNFEPINPSEEPPIVEQPSTESPTDETPTDDSGEVEEPLADAQPETETETEPEYQPEEEAKTNISGGTTEIGFPAWFENSLKKGGMIAGLGVLGFIGYKVADATGVIDKITEKKPAAKPTQKKDEMKAEDDMDLERAKIIKSLRREIKDLQNEKMKLEEYTNYGFTPPAMWEHDLHEQKSIESFSSQRLSRMNKFYQKELDRISDINAQIEDLSSYLSWIDEFYGTREE